MNTPRIGDTVCVQVPEGWGGRCFEMIVTEETNEHGRITTGPKQEGRYQEGFAMARCAYAERAEAPADKPTWHHPHGTPGEPCTRASECVRHHDHPGHCYTAR
jgi:hypothetical protein